MGIISYITTPYYGYGPNVMPGVNSLQFGSATIYTVNNRNHLEQLTGYTYGNGAATTRTYSADGSPLTIKAQKPGFNPLTNFSYTFDDVKGIPSARNDMARGSGQENFLYDGLNRLEKYGNPYKVYDTVAYSPSGNILSKTDAGTFGYNHPGRPYQISDQYDFPESMDTALLTASYTSGQRPLTITKSGNTASFVYNHAGERTKMAITGAANYTRTYLGGNYEREESGGTVTERLYLGDSPYDAPAVAIRTGGEAWQIYYIHRDYLGSIVAVSNASGVAVENRSFDAWGRLRDPATLQPYAHDAQPTLFLRRGYTGHEHLPEFGLINMNARLYDPVVGRFLSPDPYVQTPEFSQNFNRYSYAWNNPMIYTDPSGEFILGFITGFWKGVFTWENPFKTAWQGGVNETKIWAGLFASDPNKNFGGRVWEMVSRFTWQLPQTIAGYGFAQLSNYAGQVDKVDYYGGSTVASGNYWGQGGAITMGSFITGGRDLTADPNTSLFQHEYGHYLQSRATGPFYLQRYALPSLIDAMGSSDHKKHVVEQDANIRAYKYFIEKVPGFNVRNDKGVFDNGRWHQGSNPIKGYNWFLDYNDAANQLVLKNGLVRPKWWDYVLVPAVVIPGIINVLNLKQ